ncbi:hypothetical protein FEM48_Zijuj05G0149100 [Ziziphus jujuba var. spinosa]|uniref:RING-type E3 ubiquitin transferase n=1 Tax=Ziziphus jujuba var. spinosa TaxID=714518 RepID=A0A978VFG6_ZIZJJ|nr:hypothetical protein FEM48_Zijuj05G0149100 [Ziziphus jujuba var. spinosa]
MMKKMIASVTCCGSVFNFGVGNELAMDEIPPANDNENDNDSDSDYDYDYDYHDDDKEDMDESDNEEPEFEPASRVSIEELERVKVEGCLNEEGGCCSVCLDDLETGCVATRMPCSHVFHGDCIVEWLQKSKYCPLCRFQMPY